MILRALIRSKKAIGELQSDQDFITCTETTVDRGVATFKKADFKKADARHGGESLWVASNAEKQVAVIFDSRGKTAMAVHPDDLKALVAGSVAGEFSEHLGIAATA